MDLNQVTITSRDLERAIPFYQKLGLRLIVEAKPRYARFECPTGNATFSIHYHDKIQSGNGTTVYFEVEKLDEYVAELITKGITFNEMPMDQSWLWREARLKDPDGNLIILYYAGKNRKNPPWRIK